MKEVPVLIRVFNRLEDLRVNVEIIERRWHRSKYAVYVASNGWDNGYPLPNNLIDGTGIILLSGNPGHRLGATQLLREGLAALPAEYRTAVTLEADTWVLDDKVVDHYLSAMENDPGVAWTGGNWVDKYHSVAVDLAVVNLDFFRRNREILEFAEGESVESLLYKRIVNRGGRVMRLREAEPTHLPKATPWAVQAWGRRRRVFPRVPMVTHHIEHLHGGLREKMLLANRTAGELVFPDAGGGWLAGWRCGYRCYEAALGPVPKSRWFRGRKYKGSA